MREDIAASGPRISVLEYRAGLLICQAFSVMAMVRLISGFITAVLMQLLLHMIQSIQLPLLTSSDLGASLSNILAQIR